MRSFLALILAVGGLAIVLWSIAMLWLATPGASWNIFTFGTQICVGFAITVVGLEIDARQHI